MTMSSKELVKAMAEFTAISDAFKKRKEQLLDQVEINLAAINTLPLTPASKENMVDLCKANQEIIEKVTEVLVAVEKKLKEVFAGKSKLDKADFAKFMDLCNKTHAEAEFHCADSNKIIAYFLVKHRVSKSNPNSPTAPLSPSRTSDDEAEHGTVSPMSTSPTHCGGSPHLAPCIVQQYQQAIPIPSAPPMDMDFNPKDFPPPAFSEACPTAIQPARQNFMPGYVAMVGKAKVDPALQAACDLINSLPTVKAKGIVLTLQSDFLTASKARNLAINYDSDDNIDLSERIFAADDILEPYFKQLKNSSNNYPHMAVKV